MESLERKIDGQLFEKILTFGALNLQANVKEINDLNVFPVPDGDTGTNMYATLAGGIDSLQKQQQQSIELKAGSLAEGMLLNARGNSGVILSQLFYGIAQGLMGLKVATLPEFAIALKKGVEYAYKAVVKPVEGTILTVAREAAEKTYSKIDKETTVQAFFSQYLSELKISLGHTPDLLKVLKDSNVVDSGGAGLVCIAEGFYKAIIGDDSLGEIAFTAVENNSSSLGEINFDRYSKMDFGYCTEALVQLLDAKGGVENFNLQAFIEFLSGLGDSVVAVQTGTKVKIHVHTLTPAIVLAECQKYGEFMSVKIENMTLQHNELFVEEKQVEMVNCAIVAVGSGEGIIDLYKECGADYVVVGGQTDNPSTEQFIDAFKSVNAQNIFVLPNNKNVVMAAKQAGELFKCANVTVMPSKTPQQVYSALVVATDRENLSVLEEDMLDAISQVQSYSVTYAVRDAQVGEVNIEKGDYMAFAESQLMHTSKTEIDCLRKIFENAEDIEDKEIITVFYGKTITEDIKEQVRELAQELVPDAELVEYDGNQEVYSFLLSIE